MRGFTFRRIVLLLLLLFPIHAFSQGCGLIEQSTAFEAKIGPFLDSGDGNTPETTLTISQADVRLAKTSGDWAQKAETTTAVHEENGWYRVLLNSTDTNTLGPLVLAVHETGALPVWCHFMVIAAASYDVSVEGNVADGASIIADTNDIQARLPDALTVAGNIKADALAWNALTTVALPLVPTTAGRTLDVTATGEAGVDFSNVNGTIDAGEIGADAVTAAKVAADVGTEIRTGLLTLPKNTAYNNFPVTFFGTTGLRQTGLTTATITCNVFLDGGAANAVDDTTETELDATNAPGVYILNLTAAETNGDSGVLVCKTGGGLVAQANFQTQR